MQSRNCLPARRRTPQMPGSGAPITGAAVWAVGPPGKAGRAPHKGRQSEGEWADELGAREQDGSFTSSNDSCHVAKGVAAKTGRLVISEISTDAPSMPHNDKGKNQKRPAKAQD
ncbi:uncharacterized protein LOC144297098 [Canis aureus]